ncbi:uncharacterized protein V1518DRAFT_415061 [Limtongia smithiae]|uniref:uncharacterized protein n=1 Tax=Limtongia smithiae TaxID=1125753 RepID=UPI0034CE3A1C
MFVAGVSRAVAAAVATAGATAPASACSSAVLVTSLRGAIVRGFASAARPHLTRRASRALPRTTALCAQGAPHMIQKIGMRLATTDAEAKPRKKRTTKAAAAELTKKTTVTTAAAKKKPAAKKAAPKKKPKAKKAKKVVAKKPKKAKAPPKPPRVLKGRPAAVPISPRNKWVLFMMDFTSDKKGSKTSLSDYASAAKDTYRALTPAETAALDIRVEADRVRYDNEVQAYITEHGLAALRKENLRRRKVSKARVQLMLDPNRPRRPPNTFGQFMLVEAKKDIYHNLPIGERGRKMAEVYKALSDEAKDVSFYFSLGDVHLD